MLHGCINHWRIDGWGGGQKASIATKVDSTYLGYSPTAHSAYVFV